MIDLLAQTEPQRQAVGAVVSPRMGVFFVAFFLSFLLTPIMRALALRNGIIDAPDLQRKEHLKPVAYLGGVAIFVGWFAGAVLCFTLWNTTANVMVSIILGAAAIHITGLLDDVYHISPRVKVGGQLFAAAALAMQDVGVKLAESAVTMVGLEPYVPDVIVYILGAAVIALFVIGGCNATNLLDGLDGLAAGVSIIGLVGFLLCAALIVHNPEIQTDPVYDIIRISMILAALGSLMGFLPYNFNPASIFMGDAGSLLVGYLCMASVLLFTPDTGSAAPRLVTALLIIFALPITDTLLAIIRRKIQGRPISAPDNQHVHHLLRRSGLGVKRTVILLYGCALMFMVIGVVMVWLNLRWRYILAVFFPLYGFIMVFLYHYAQHLTLREKLNQTGAAAPSTEA